MTSCGGALGAGTGHDTAAIGCSKTGVVPQARITWFQAAQMCANAGKRLCTNEEWQTAVAGTLDPGASDGSLGACVTNAALRNTGLGTNCRSRFGAEDMIGNYWEWVADWYEAGAPWQGTADGSSTNPWPSGYGADAT